MIAPEQEMLDRAQRETRVFADLVGLGASSQEYAEIVRLTLDLVEELVSSPLVCLSITEFGEIGQYARARNGVDPGWAEEACRAITRSHEHWLRHDSAPDARRPPGPAPWFVNFPAGTRSGRAMVLALASTAPLSLAGEEEQLMGRLAEQIALVLDHALLLEQIEQLETADRLTGAANHRRLLDVLDYELGRHRSSGRWFALLLLDIEGLDGINRSYGRRYGNHILRKLASLVRETVRPIDTVARCGADELAVLLPEANEAEAEAMLVRLRERLLGIEFAGGEIGLTAAVTHVKPGEPVTPESVLLRAEQALDGEKKRQRRGWTARLQGSAAR